VVRFCVPARGFAAHPLSLGIVQHDQETPAVPLERATHLARSPAVSDLIGRCAPPLLRSSQSPARASLRFSIREDTVVGAQTLLSSIQCNWPLNLLSQFWGSLHSARPGRPQGGRDTEALRRSRPQKA